MEKIQRSENGEEILIQKTETLSISESSNTPKSTKKVSKSATKSTGAIPKSISFDSSADKVNKNDNLAAGNMGFLNKIKRGLKMRHNGNSSSSNRWGENWILVHDNYNIHIFLF
jgi:hypothetical protein